MPPRVSARVPVVSERATPREVVATQEGRPVVKSRERKRPAPEVVASAVRAFVEPLPKRREPSATEERPVPPPPTPRSPASVLVKVRVVPLPVTVVEAVSPLNAVLEVAMTRAPVRAEPVGPRERTPVFVTLPAEYESPLEKVVVATQPGTPFTEPRTNPPVPMPSLERRLVAEE